MLASLHCWFTGRWSCRLSRQLQKQLRPTAAITSTCLVWAIVVSSLGNRAADLAPPFSPFCLTGADEKRRTRPGRARVREWQPAGGRAGASGRMDDGVCRPRWGLDKRRIRSSRWTSNVRKEKWTLVFKSSSKCLLNLIQQGCK